MMDVIVWMIYGVGVVDVYVYMGEWMDMCMGIIWRAHYSYEQCMGYREWSARVHCIRAVWMQGA